MINFSREKFCYFNTASTLLKMIGTTETNEVSIAIYPFQNFTGRDELNDLCKSFHIDLLTEFTRFRQFTLIPHELIENTGIFSEYSFKGSFRYQNDRLKVNAQLINNQKNVLIWADWHEMEKEAIFSIQEDLLRQVITALHLQVNYDVLIDIRKKSPSHLTAYENWLFGMEELKKGMLEADEKARSHFQKAIEIYPSYSLAFSGMSLTYFNEWSCQLWERWDVSHKGAYEWAKKAIELDEQNYIAAMVLGRIYLYEAEYDLAEHYLRKALRLNPNDTECVMQIATCFVFLGYLDEAESLYRNAPELSHLKHDFAYIGALIAFEKGDIKKSIALIAQSKPAWVDFHALMAAAYYEFGDSENMQRCWQNFLDHYQRKIRNGEKLEDQSEAIQWVINVNPFRNTSRQIPFLEYIGNKKISAPTRSFLKVAKPDARNIFIREDELWQISFDGKTIRMAEAKGLYDIQRMLREPDKQFHCTDLNNHEGNQQPVLVFDEKAKRAYKNKILELQGEIQSAEYNNDFGRASILQKEYDDILHHLTVSLGLNGRTRKANDPIDKTRSAVTWRIRNVIRKMETLHPVLGKHLAASIRTGIFCSYTPEKAVHWITD